MADVRAPADRDDWIALASGPLPAAEAQAWVVVPSCGGVVTFCGTVRDHATDEAGVARARVSALEYEAYDGPAQDRMAAIAREARRRWPVIGRIALLHRTGRLDLGDTAEVVAVSAPHRAEAFEAARWAIDTLKETVPIWKREEWGEGAAWGTGATAIGEVPAPEWSYQTGHPRSA